MSCDVRREILSQVVKSRGGGLSDSKVRHAFCPIEDFTLSHAIARIPSHPAHAGQGHAPRPPTLRTPPVLNGACWLGKVEVGSQAARRLR